LGLCYNIGVPKKSKEIQLKVVIGDFYSNIYPTDEEVISECKIGDGPNTCIFLVMAPTGWECVAQDFRQNMQLIARAESGAMVAKRQGCERVNTWNSEGMGIGTEHEIP
jgi:hypothetical protein